MEKNRKRKRNNNYHDQRKHRNESENHGRKSMIEKVKVKQKHYEDRGK